MTLLLLYIVGVVVAVITAINVAVVVVVVAVAVVVVACFFLFRRWHRVILRRCFWLAALSAARTDYVTAVLTTA